MKIRISIPFLAAALVFCVGLIVPSANAANDPNLVDPKILPAEWDDETVKTFASLVVQDERLKPMASYASVKLLKFRGIKGVRLNLVGGGKRDLKPAAWMLDSLFYPEAARQYPVFLVEDRDALEVIGLTVDKKKRERYTYNEIEPARERMLESAMRYAKIEAKQRTAVQNMIVELANNVTDFEYLTKALDFARQGIPRYSGEDSFDEAPERVPASTFISEDLQPFVGQIRAHGTIDRMPPMLSEVANEFLGLAQAARGSVSGLHLFPSPKLNEKEWLTCGDLLFGTMQLVPFDSAGEADFTARRDWAAERLGSMEKLVALRDDRSAFLKELQAYSDARAADMEPRIAAAAKADAEDWQKSQARQFAVSGTEVTYHKANFFKNAMFALFLIFIAVAVTWMNPQARWARVTRASAYWLAFVPLILIAVGMGFRIYIMGRPPVTELYETVPYITFIVLGVGLLMDKVLKQPFMLPLACGLGVLGLLVANQYEVVEGNDTMKELTAVLRSNFWLTIHVLVVLVGYAAGILASVMSAVYILSRVFDIRRKKTDYFRVLTRATYGVLCFGLLFSLVGTILGGIWANYSWGRFWGWDPKENGALMIVLWFLMILHARMGGYIKEFGLHMLSTLGGAVVVFSWFHTNQLGVGLHSYGFTSGVMFAINLAYLVLGLVFVTGLITNVIAGHLKSQDKSAGKEKLPDGAGA